MRREMHRRWARWAPAVLAPLALALVVAEAAAQPGLSVSIGRAFGSIGAPGEDAEGRQTTVGAVEAEHVLASDRLRLYYEFDGGTYATPGDWHYTLHTAGGTWRVPFGSDQKNRLHLGAFGSWRTNGLSWSASDYRAVGFMANTELHPSDHATVRFGYRLDARHFPDLTELNQVQHDGFASALVNFPSRTTLIGEVHLGAKSYADTVTASSLADMLSPSTPAAGSGRMGRGMGPSLRASALLEGLQAEPHRAGMVTWLARVAQSLADRTGATLQYTERVTFGRVAPIVVSTPPAYFEDGVYDDPFASDARVLTATLKHLTAGGMVLEGFASRMQKGYNGLTALDSDGEALSGLPSRADRVWRAGAGWTLPLFASKTGPVGLDLNVNYYFTRHRSNDVFYNYTSHAAGLGVTVSY